ncbi:helix-turn-helix domain-containing protein [Microbacterium karelineae]|uniref:helix-turn-helix domain-containing protein n=1 Tax=Microbacterium karelineae TaxID=2654283 RepID=UPI0034D1DF27
MLELLQLAQQRSVAELADRLGVDGRTIRRDMARLIDLGLPVEALRRLSARARPACAPVHGHRRGGRRASTGDRPALRQP